jgi:hypothetical protein
LTESAEHGLVIDAVLGVYRSIHRALRAQVEVLDDQALAWVPVSGANSISTMLVHTLGSEREVLRIVHGLPSDRDRPSEFTRPATSAAYLLNQLADADALLTELGEQITPADLAAVRERGEREPQTGIRWLVSNVAHAREHLGQVELTRQLYEQRRL